MANEGPVPAHVNPQDLWRAIDGLRQELGGAISELRKETREARHTQANNTSKAIAELHRDLDNRLRELERAIAASNPISLGPRINDLETWQSKADGQSNLPKRLGDLEDWRDEMRGVVSALRIVSVVATIVSTVAGLVVLVSNLS